MKKPLEKYLEDYKRNPVLLNNFDYNPKKVIGKVIPVGDNRYFIKLKIKR